MNDLSVITPQRSLIEVHTRDSWKEFLRQRRITRPIEGTFLPRTLTAHIQGDNLFYQISIFHEYFGHGSFCEHSTIGQRIVAYERELEGLESELIIDEKGIITEYSKDFVKLRKEAEAYSRNKYNFYEGFAYWVERHLSREAGIDELYSERVIRDDYEKLVEACDEYVSKNGIKAFLVKMSFRI